MGKNNSAPSVPTVPLTMLQPRKAINFNVQMVFANTGIPQNLPPIIVPPGATVQVLGCNGSAGNAYVVYVGRYPEQTRDLSALVVAPSYFAQDAVPFPVDNLNQIWAQGHAGDGLTVMVRGVEIG